MILRKLTTLLLTSAFLLTCAIQAKAGDTTYIKVHFLYGSKPKVEYKDSESKWFGGILGGHVGIEVDSNKIMDFVGEGKLHIFEKTNNKHSRFTVRSPKSFWEIFNTKAETVKKATVTIPITEIQKEKLDSIFKTYTSETPYDYAFFGMRCGAAAYDVLGQLGIVAKLSHRKTYLKIFYPRKLRKRLLTKAEKENWKVLKKAGTTKRRWEQDL